MRLRPLRRPRGGVCADDPTAPTSPYQLISPLFSIAFHLLSLLPSQDRPPVHTHAAHPQGKLDWQWTERVGARGSDLRARLGEGGGSGFGSSPWQHCRPMVACALLSSVTATAAAVGRDKNRWVFHRSASHKEAGRPVPQHLQTKHQGGDAGHSLQAHGGPVCLVDVKVYDGDA